MTNSTSGKLNCMLTSARMFNRQNIKQWMVVNGKTVS